jgi:hypothetical protein
MDAVSAIRALVSLTPEMKVRIVAMLCHELTIVARESYGEGTEVRVPHRLRAVNEIEHRMTGFLIDLLERGGSDCAHDAIVKFFFSDREDRHLQSLLAFSFERVIRRGGAGQSGIN